MSKKDNESERKLTAYERWELPNLESDQSSAREDSGPAILIQRDVSVTTEEVDQESLVYEPLTASQLEEIRSAAYEEGYIQGEEDGNKKGYEDGHVKGQEDGFLAGHKEGHLIGMEEGKREATELAKGQLEAIEKVLTEVVKEIENPLEHSRSAVEHILYDTMTRIVENVCLSQMSQESSKVLKSQLSRVLDEIGEYEGRIRLRLNPKDIELLDSLNIDDRLTIQVDSDESLIEGGFVLDSKSFHVDGSVEQRLNAVCNELRHLSSLPKE